MFPNDRNFCKILKKEWHICKRLEYVLSITFDCVGSLQVRKIFSGLYISMYTLSEDDKKSVEFQNDRPTTVKEVAHTRYSLSRYLEITEH